MPSLQVYDSARRPPRFWEEFVELVRYRELLWLWSLRNLTLRYKRSTLGVAWTLLEPLLMMAILSVVFTALFRLSVQNYPVYVLSGLLVFDFFSRSTLQMMDEVVTSQHLAGKVYTARSAFPLAAATGLLANWLLALVPLFLLMLVLGARFSWALLALPLGMLITALFAVGVGLVVATVAAFFHDVKLIYQVLVTAWFYATPIIYPLEIVPEPWRGVLKLNPLYHLTTLIRDPIFEARLPSLETWLVAAGFGLLAVVLGWTIFTRKLDLFGAL
jgi:homopolymeric O-antigen transport system permease protein